VEDVARAHAAAVEAPRELVHGRAFNVGVSAENYQVREIARVVREVVPGSRVVHAEELGPDARSYRVDCGEIQRALGYEARWTLREGVEELYEGLRAGGFSVGDLSGSKFERIRRLRGLVETGDLDRTLRRVAVAGAPL
jgi:nucleoside-diphosphate-sugar epimerase